MTMKKLKLFEEFASEPNEANNNMTMKKLMDHLNMLKSKFGVKDDDCIFLVPPGEDEGDPSVLIPVTNITSGVKFLKTDQALLSKLMKKEGATLVPVSPKTYED